MNTLDPLILIPVLNNLISKSKLSHYDVFDGRFQELELSTGHLEMAASASAFDYKDCLLHFINRL